MKDSRTGLSYSALDLFSGAGGFSLGLEYVGFHAVGAIDIDEKAGRTFRANFGERPIERFGRVHGDMRRVRPGEISAALARAGVEELDLLVAGPPCQGFSRVGRGKLDSMADQAGAFVLDPRNHLYRQAIAMLIELRPRVFVFENVTGILHVRGQNMAERVCEAVAAEGYAVKCAVLNSAWFGVPQVRERLFVMGVREDLDMRPSFPIRRNDVRTMRGHFSEAVLAPATWKNQSFFAPFEELRSAPRLRPAVCVHDAFHDLPPFTDHLRAVRLDAPYRTRRESFGLRSYRNVPMTDYCRLMREWPRYHSDYGVTDHFCRWTPRDFETFRRMKWDDRYRQAMEVARARYREAKVEWELGTAPFPRFRDYVPPYPEDCFDEKWRKLDPRRPSHTVTAHLAKDTYSHIHPSHKQARAITPREAARLQSFPDAFVFDGNMGDMFRQIGNAVPPLLAAAIGSEIKRLLAAVDAENAGDTWRSIRGRRASLAAL